MRIQKLRIENFRSINEIEIDLNTKINILVGTNESGKSNILRAISRMDRSDNYPFEENDISRLIQNQNIENIPSISIKFTLSESEGRELIKTIISFVPRNEIDSLKNKDLPLMLTAPFTIQYTKRYVAEHSFVINGKFLSQYGIKEDKIEDVNKALLDFVKPILYFGHKDVNLLKDRTSVMDFVKNPDKYPTLKNLLKIGGFTDYNLFNNGYKANSKLVAVTKKINRIFPKWWKQDTSIEFFIIIDHENFINIHISDSTSSEESPESRSEGVQWFMSFLINFLATTNESDNEKTVLLFDEFALHIHPKAQKDLLLLLEDFSKTNQIIYTTHFPFLIDQNHPERINLVSKQNDNSNFGTKVNNKPYTELWKNIRNEIGIMLSDSFILSEKTLIVEGASELFLLRAINNFFKNLDMEYFSAEEIILLPREGKGFNLLQMIFFCKAAKLNVSILVDGDGEEEKVKKLIKNEDFITEQKFISLKKFVNYNEEVTIEDLIPSSIYVFCLNSFYKKIKPTWKEIIIEDVIKQGKTKLIDNIISLTSKISQFGSFDKVGVIREICLFLDNSESKPLYDDFRQHWDNVELLILQIKNSFKDEK